MVKPSKFDFFSPNFHKLGPIWAQMKTIFSKKKKKFIGVENISDIQTGKLSDAFYLKWKTIFIFWVISYWVNSYLLNFSILAISSCNSCDAEVHFSIYLLNRYVTLLKLFLKIQWNLNKMDTIREYLNCPS